jgi:hypothetical protein
MSFEGFLNTSQIATAIIYNRGHNCSVSGSFIRERGRYFPPDGAAVDAKNKLEGAACLEPAACKVPLSRLLLTENSELLPALGK